MSHSTTIWNEICESLKQDFGEGIVRSWLKHLTVTKITDDKIFFEAPNGFMKDWILTHYVERIIYYWSKKNPNIKYVDVSVTEQNQQVSQITPLESEGDVQTSNITNALDKRFTFENFVVGKP
ncbi:MAG: DnaA N-terminal domain-containing protein, partial [Alphaproteobacteria bacterium]